MGLLPQEELGFFELMQRAIWHHLSALKQMWVMILLMVFVKDWYIYLGGMPTHGVMSWIVSVFMGVTLLYLFCVGLRISYTVWHQKTVSMNDVFLNTLKRLPYALVVILIFMVSLFALLYAAKYSAQGLIHMGHSAKVSGLVALFFILMFPYILGVVMFVFALPLTVIESMPVLKAFKESFWLIMPKQWFAAFGLYAVTAAMLVLISPDTLHGHFLKRYYLNAPFDLLVLGVFMPFLCNLFVLMINDCRLRQEDD